MTESLLTKNPTNEDLLTKIQRETHERLRELRGAVQEHEWLTAELRTLQDVTEPSSVTPELPAALGVVPGPGVVTELPVALDVDSEPHAAFGVLPEPGVVTESPAALDIASESPAALDIASESPAAPDIASESPAAPDVDPEPPGNPELSVAPELSVVPEPSTNVTRLPARRPLSRTRMVSPKVARLMRAPRRPALERSGVARVSTRARSSLGDDLFPGVDSQAIDEVDVEAERYERSL